MDQRPSVAASGTTYHSFHDVELFEPASPPKGKAASTADWRSQDPENSRSGEERPHTSVQMKRQDSGYESNTPTPRTSVSRSRPSPPLRRRTSVSVNPGTHSRPRTRPSTRRSAKSYHHPNNSSVHVVHPPPSSYFHFPSPEPEPEEPCTPALSNQQLPPQTTHYWTSDRTRRLEYAAIDAAHRGVKGWIRRNLLPDCLVPRSDRHIPFDDDTGSVRRYRLDLEDESPHHDNKSTVPKRRTWHFWSGRGIHCYTRLTSGHGQVQARPSSNRLEQRTAPTLGSLLNDQESITSKRQRLWEIQAILDGVLIIHKEATATGSPRRTPGAGHDSPEAMVQVQMELASLKTQVAYLIEERFHLQQENATLRKVSSEVRGCEIKLREAKNRLGEESLRLQDEKERLDNDYKKIAKENADLHKHIDAQVEITKELLGVMAQTATNWRWDGQTSQTTLSLGNEASSPGGLRRSSGTSCESDTLSVHEWSSAQSLSQTSHPEVPDATSPTVSVKHEETGDDRGGGREMEERIRPIPNSPQPAARSSGVRATMRKRPSDWTLSPRPAASTQRTKRARVITNYACRSYGDELEEEEEAVSGLPGTLEQRLSSSRSSSDDDNKQRPSVEDENAVYGSHVNGDDGDGAYEPSENEEPEDNALTRTCSRSPAPSSGASSTTPASKMASAASMRKKKEKKKRYQKARKTTPRYASGVPGVVFQFHRMGNTVRSVWEQWFHGFRGNPAIERLEREHHTAWRSGEDLKYASNYVGARRMIVEYMAVVAEREGVTQEEACALLDETFKGRLQELRTAIRAWNKNEGPEPLSP